MVLRVGIAPDGHDHSCRRRFQSYWCDIVSCFGLSMRYFTGCCLSATCCAETLALSLIHSLTLQPHTHTITHSHTLLITCTCCYDQIKGTQDKDFSYSFSDSHSLTLFIRCRHHSLTLFIHSCLQQPFTHHPAFTLTDTRFVLHGDSILF